MQKQWISTSDTHELTDATSKDANLDFRARRNGISVGEHRQEVCRW